MASEWVVFDGDQWQNECTYSASFAMNVRDAGDDQRLPLRTMGGRRSLVCSADNPKDIHGCVLAFGASWDALDASDYRALSFDVYTSGGPIRSLDVRLVTSAYADEDVLSRVVALDSRFQRPQIWHHYVVPIAGLYDDAQAYTRLKALRFFGQGAFSFALDSIELVRDLPSTPPANVLFSSLAVDSLQAPSSRMTRSTGCDGCVLPVVVVDGCAALTIVSEPRATDLCTAALTISANGQLADLRGYQSLSFRIRAQLPPLSTCLVDMEVVSQRQEFVSCPLAVFDNEDLGVDVWRQVDLPLASLSVSTLGDLRRARAVRFTLPASAQLWLTDVVLR